MNAFAIKDQILIIAAIVLPHILGEEHHLEDNNNNQLRTYIVNFSQLENLALDSGAFDITV
ncbi:MAG: hypothetical protein M3M87_02460 [Thermoproteota archaeon]|nr:hypothetical protein [Thermoproteota archaeon]